VSDGPSSALSSAAVPSRSGLINQPVMIALPVNNK
jgi:hypothetical protein